MKEKSNATLRRAASLRCRTDAAIARLGRAVAYYQKGAITTAELLREASAAADRAGTLELSVAELAATGSFGRSVNRKVADYRNYACTAARIAMGYKSNTECRRQALAFARTAARSASASVQTAVQNVKGNSVRTAVPNWKITSQAAEK